MDQCISVGFNSLNQVLNIHLSCLEQVMFVLINSLQVHVINQPRKADRLFIRYSPCSFPPVLGSVSADCPPFCLFLYYSLYYL